MPLSRNTPLRWQTHPFQHCDTADAGYPHGISSSARLRGSADADGNYDEDEKSFVTNFAEAISLSEPTVEDLTIAIKDYLNVLKRISELIF